MATSSTQHQDIFNEEDDKMKQSELAIRDFKHEPDDFVPESLNIEPLALGAPGDKFESTSAKGKKFRCPFRTEDNRVCNDSNDTLNEVLCHFYARHFARSMDNEKNSKWFQPLRCFYRSCSKTFRLHHMLVGHMHKHEGGIQNLWFINYLYENLKNNNDLKISDLKALHKEDIKDFQGKVEEKAATIVKQAATIRKLMGKNGIYKKFQEQLEDQKKFQKQLDDQKKFQKQLDDQKKFQKQLDDQKFQKQLDDQKKLYEMLMVRNEQLLKENQDLKQSAGYGPSKQQARVVTLDKYNELLALYKVEKERVEAQEGMFEAEKGRTEAEKRRADTEKKRADLLEKSDEYWEEGPSKRKREYKEEQ